jgi:poly-gamma-glutamate capsule biosynthesis protein CapA/YwtB (metallophosphatase superfamily)
VGAAGDELVDRRTVHGVEVVNLGWNGAYTRMAEITRAIASHKKADNLVIVSFHWGVERKTRATAVQRALGRAAIDAIDAGADAATEGG